MCERQDSPVSVSSQQFFNHLSIIQGIIHRVAGYTLHAKTIAITVISILGAIYVVTKSGNIVIVGLTAIIAISFLDAVCLSLERELRCWYDKEIAKANSGLFREKDLYVIKIEKKYLEIPNLMKAYRSWSIWLVYSCYAVVVVLFRFVS